MKKVLLLFWIILLFFSSSYTQEKSRGLSAPGSLGKNGKPALKHFGGSGIHCQISFKEPSGDNILSKGESGTIIVNVRNQTKKKIKPNLEIVIQPSWLVAPKKKYKSMGNLLPGQSKTYTSKIKWSYRFPMGAITYEAKATDIISSEVSETAQVYFIINNSNLVKPTIVDVDKKIPETQVQNENGIAVVIGNENYQNPDAPNLDYAINDASTIREYLINMLGYNASNIIFIKDAKKSDFERIFGTREIYEGKLYNWVLPNQSDVFIYYSGHGAPDLKNKKTYFMPSNCDPNYVKIDGYPLEVFYRNIEKIPAKSVTIVIDACFSGGSQQGMLLKNASPMYIDMETSFGGNKFNLLTSARGDQIASWYPEGNHSLFTYYFLRALRGEADKDKNRSITLREVKNFVTEHVSYKARRLYGREQTPVIKGNQNKVISTY